MKRSFQNVVILFALMVVFTSCGDGWKKYIPLSVDKELGIQSQNQYDLMYKNQILIDLLALGFFYLSVYTFPKVF